MPRSSCLRVASSRSEANCANAASSRYCASARRDYVKSKHGDLAERIESTKDLSTDDEAKLHAAIKEFKKNAAY